MGLWPTHRDESALLRFIDSKQVTRDFRGSVMTGVPGEIFAIILNIGGIGRETTNQGNFSWMCITACRARSSGL